ncbi:S49 family peptidase [Deinococcus arenicola]|uniref:S49 family peptidase n=1 Tax=Deinococcus arenicola TaxID=2994950 RepID=A0ABU4DUW9_9DEIO|nr:S49 family peptidase [Deinococcus sp. ZS9-10]MDV6376238.1 S49 family peptidase [Deinococcus sp. ZS9-10]
MNNLQFLARALSGEAWSITPQALDHLHNQLASGQTLKVDADQSAPEAAVQRVPLLRNNGKTVALVSLHGVIVSRAPAWAEHYGYVGPQSFAAQIRTLADDSSVASIIISVDSPGGSVAGTMDAAEAVAYARTRKKTTAVVNDMACSAAYWAVSQASEIVVSPTAMTGSIGVLIVHADYSKMLGLAGIVVNYIRSAAKKALGQPYEALSDEARAEFQATVDSMNAQFVQTVAKGRRKARAVVAESWATGEIWIGADAVTQGLADRVASLQTILGEQTGAIVPADPAPPSPDDEEDLEARASPPPTASSGPPDPAQNANATEDPPATLEAGSSIPISAPQAQEEHRVNIKDILAKVQNGQALSAEERTHLNAHLDGQPAPAANVDLSQLSPEARAAVEKAQADATAAHARAERAETTANTERDTRLNREFSERAVALGQPAAFGATLRSASEKMTAEEYTALEQSLNATGAQQRLLGESGSSKDNRDSGNAQGDYNTRVAAHIKANPGTSRANAGRAVLAADPAFAQRYQKQ